MNAIVKRGKVQFPQNLIFKSFPSLIIDLSKTKKIYYYYKNIKIKKDYS